MLLIHVSILKPNPNPDLILNPDPAPEWGGNEPSPNLQNTSRTKEKEGGPRCGSGNDAGNGEGNGEGSNGEILCCDGTRSCFGYDCGYESGYESENDHSWGCVDRPPSHGCPPSPPPPPPPPPRPPPPPPPPPPSPSTSRKLNTQAVAIVSKAQVPGLQLSHSQLQRRDGTRHLRNGSNNHRSCASEVMVVAAVATFSTLRLHMRRSSSQSARPVLLHGATRKPGGVLDDCTPSNSLTGQDGLRRTLPLRAAVMSVWLKDITFSTCRIRGSRQPGAVRFSCSPPQRDSHDDDHRCYGQRGQLATSTL
ncbi:hypothetical protein F7725_006672 [Dissostichus mawsoni]|uniref:Uncharacterized protein n=1 Tax=Dissostichus mawsoni TaxID=36200 RepID=A0A7J5XUK4_DISMA|nr:hypothetical protein F7725_006672 [Dissostichus mawsoni]